MPTMPSHATPANRLCALVRCDVQAATGVLKLTQRRWTPLSTDACCAPCGGTALKNGLSQRDSRRCSAVPAHQVSKAWLHRLRLRVVGNHVLRPQLLTPEAACPAAMQPVSASHKRRGQTSGTHIVYWARSMLPQTARMVSSIKASVDCPQQHGGVRLRHRSRCNLQS